MKFNKIEWIMFIAGTVILILEPKGMADAFMTPFYTYIICGILYMELATAAQRNEAIALTVNEINYIVDKLIRREMDRKLTVIAR